MESEEAILENENNFNVELESNLRDRDSQQAVEELLDDHGSDTFKQQDLSPAHTTQDESDVNMSGDRLKGAVRDGCSSEELMVQDESCKNEGAAETSTPVADSREEGIQDYEDFIGNDDNSQHEQNDQFRVSENVDHNEKVPGVTSDSEGQEPMEVDNCGLDCVEASATSSSEQTGGIEQGDADESVWPTDQHYWSGGKQKDPSGYGTNVLKYETSKEAEPLVTDQSGSFKGAFPDTADCFRDLLEENLENSASSKDNTEEEMLMGKKIVPGSSQQDNTFTDASKEVETSVSVEDNVDNDILPEGSWELPRDVEMSEQDLLESADTCSLPEAANSALSLKKSAVNLLKDDGSCVEMVQQEASIPPTSPVNRVGSSNKSREDDIEEVEFSDQYIEEKCVKEMESFNQDKAKDDKDVDSSYQDRYEYVKQVESDNLDEDVEKMDSSNDGRGEDEKEADSSNDDRDADEKEAYSSNEKRDVKEVDFSNQGWGKYAEERQLSNEDNDENDKTIDISNQDRDKNLADSSYQDRRTDPTGLDSFIEDRDEDVIGIDSSDRGKVDDADDVNSLHQDEDKHVVLIDSSNEEVDEDVKSSNEDRNEHDKTMDISNPNRVSDFARLDSSDQIRDKDITQMDSSNEDKEDVPCVDSSNEDKEDVPCVDSSNEDKEDVPCVDSSNEDKEDVPCVDFSNEYKEEDFPCVDFSNEDKEDVPCVDSSNEDKEDVPCVDSSNEDKEEDFPCVDFSNEDRKDDADNVHSSHHDKAKHVNKVEYSDEDGDTDIKDVNSPNQDRGKDVRGMDEAVLHQESTSSTEKCSYDSAISDKILNDTDTPSGQINTDNSITTHSSDNDQGIQVLSLHTSLQEADKFDDAGTPKNNLGMELLTKEASSEACASSGEDVRLESPGDVEADNVVDDAGTPENDPDVELLTKEASSEAYASSGEDVRSESPGSGDAEADNVMDDAGTPKNDLGMELLTKEASSETCASSGEDVRSESPGSGDVEADNVMDDAGTPKNDLGMELLTKEASSEACASTMEESRSESPRDVEADNVMDDAGTPENDLGMELLTKEASSETCASSGEDVKSECPGSRDVEADKVMDDAEKSVDNTLPSAECRNEIGTHVDEVTKDEISAQVKISEGDSKSSSESVGEKFVLLTSAESRQIPSSESQKDTAVDASVHDDSISREDVMEVTAEAMDTESTRLPCVDKAEGSEIHYKNPNLCDEKQNADLLHGDTAGDQSTGKPLHTARDTSGTPEPMDVSESAIQSSEGAPEIGVVEASSASGVTDSSERNNTDNKGTFTSDTDASSDGVASPLTQSTSSSTFVQNTSPTPPVQDTSPTPPVQDTSPIPPVQDANPTPPVQDTSHTPLVQDTSPTPPVQDINPTPPVQDINPTPPVQDTSPTPPVQDTSTTPQVQDTSTTPPVQDINPTPLVQDTSPTPLVQNTRTKSKKAVNPKTEANSGKSVKNEVVEKNVDQPKTEQIPPASVKRPQRARRSGNKVEDKAALVPIKNEISETKFSENGLQVKNSPLGNKQQFLKDDDNSTITLASSDTKKTESSRSKSSRSRTQTCLVCQKICKCKYNIVRNGDVKHLCDDPCFKQFRNTPSIFLKVPENSKPSKISSKASVAPPPVQVEDAVVVSQQEMEPRQNATYKTCAVCQLLNLNASQPFCNWKGLDFCGESCLGKFQANLNSVCSFCHAFIPVESRPGCCVKIGNDMHLFCKQRCCNEFKKKLRLCSFCQKDVSGILGAFSAMVGTVRKLKEFCSQACMRKLENRMKEFDLILVEKGGSVTCATCKKIRPLKYNVWLKGKLNTLCSDMCLSVFKHTKNISTDACDKCGTICSAEETQTHFVQYAGQLKQFCSDTCASHFCKANSRVESCSCCGTNKMNFDMIERQDAENKFMMFCSLNCLALCHVKLQTKTGQPVACDQCRKVEPAQYHLTMSDASIRNYCSYSCVLMATNRTSPGSGSAASAIPAPHHQPQQPAAQTQQQPLSSASRGRSRGRAQINTRQAAARQLSESVPVISNVVSLASPGEQHQQRPPSLQSTPVPPQSVPPQPATQKAAPSHPVPSQSALPPPTASSQVLAPHLNSSPGVTRAATGNLVPSADGKHQILIQSPPPKVGKNRSLQCKPVMQTKATSCKPHSQTKETQTDELPPKTVLVPVPVPVYIPMPTVMFTAPAPKLVPVPIPIPVPIFIPTTRKSVNGIFKTIQDILERMPADPLEAELLMMAEAVAADGRPGDSDTDSEADTIVEDFSVPAIEEEEIRPPPREDDTLLLRKRERQGEEDMIQMALRMAEEMSGPIEDLETSVEPVAVSSEAPPQHQQQQQQHQSIQSYESQAEDDYIPPRSGQRVTKRPNRGKPSVSRAKRPRMGRSFNDDASIQSQPAMQIQSMEPPPDANYRLKFTYGVNAWRHWILNKNAQIEKTKQVTGNYRLRNFPSDLLKCTTDDLNNTLCMFIREVRKPNGDEYSPDSIYYLCLGIQQYLFENGRIENIFTDIYFEKFTDCLNEILKTLRPKINSQGQMLCRIEEEHLWESKQLGAHSPFILLNTLIYFHTKHFILKTAQEHMSLSFAQILKHWKKGMPLKGQSAASGKNVSLRFYCLANGKKDGLAARKNKDGLPVYEVTENFDNPLRCPVKLYEFFLSKCPESIKNRNDIFYPVPERSCVPDSPVWYSTQSIDIHTMDKMLTRVLLVREIQEAHLHAQPVYM